MIAPDSAEGRGNARARRAGACRIELWRIGIEAAPHAEHKELHDEAADKQLRHAGRMSIEEGAGGAGDQEQGRRRLAADLFEQETRGIEARNAANGDQRDKAHRFADREAVLIEDHREPGGEAEIAEQSEEPEACRHHRRADISVREDHDERITAVHRRFVDIGLRRGQRHGAAFGDIRFDRPHDGVGLVETLMIDEPARRFEEIAPHPEEDEGKETHGDKDRAPAEQRQDRIAQRAGDDEAHGPEAFHEGDIEAAMLGRNDLRQDRLRDRRFAADASADDEAADHQCDEAAGAGGKKAAQAPDQHGDLKGDTAAEAVRRIAGNNISDELAQERHRGQKSDLHGGQMKFRGDRADEKDEEGDIDLIGEPGGGNDREDLPLIGGHRQPFEPPRDIQRGGLQSRGAHRRGVRLCKQLGARDRSSNHHALLPLKPLLALV